MHGCSGSVAERWITALHRLIEANHDVKTVSVWAREAGMSPSSLRELSNLVHVRPSDARDFGRVLRTIVLSPAAWQPEAALDIADHRTLERLAARAGLAPDEIAQRPLLTVFFDKQTFVTNRQLVARVRESRHLPAADLLTLHPVQIDSKHTANRISELRADGVADRRSQPPNL